MINQLTELMLSKSVVGEEHTIDTENIKIFAKMASGEDAKNEFSILDTGVTVDLPNHFCLEKAENNTVDKVIKILKPKIIFQV